MTSYSRNEALDVLSREKFDLVITDIFLGGSGGLDILKNVKERDSDVPVILLTGSPDQQCIIDALRNKADDILIKPVSKNELYFRVDKALEKLNLRRREKRMERLMESREQLFSTFMDHLPLHIFINDEQDRLIYSNRKHDEYFDTGNKMLSRLDRIFPPDEAKALFRQNEEARRKGLLDYFQVVSTRDGRKRKFRTLLFPLELGERKNLLAGIGIDMTDQLFVREALKESEDRLAAFIRTVPHGLIENDTEGTITLCNNGYCELLGLEPEDILGRKTFEFQPTEEERRKRRELQGDLNLGRAEPEPFMSRIRRSDGQIRHVQVDWNYRKNDRGEVTGYVAAVTDVTRLLVAEGKIRRSEALLKSIMESPRNISIWSVDRDIRYTFFNYNHKHAMKHFWNADIEIGGRVLDYIPDSEYVRKAEEYYRGVLSGRHLNIQDPVTDASGTLHVFENFANPIIDAEGNVTGATIFTMDITSRVEDEKRIKQSLQEKEVLLREIHHRVKNNLQVISSILNLQSDGIEEEGVQKVFRDSQNRIRSMSLIHEQLYQTENLSAIQMEPYIQSLIAYIVDSMSSMDEAVRIDKSIESMELDIDTAIPVGLILNELVSNSIKYARNSKGADSTYVELKREGENCCIIVRDNGPGLPAEIGAGGRPSLGLQIVDALAAQLGGSFEMRNDHGLVCTLMIPTNPPV